MIFYRTPPDWWRKWPGVYITKTPVHWHENNWHSNRLIPNRMSWKFTVWPGNLRYNLRLGAWIKSNPRKNALLSEGSILLTTRITWTAPTAIETKDEWRPRCSPTSLKSVAWKSKELLMWTSLELSYQHQEATITMPDFSVSKRSQRFWLKKVGNHRLKALPSKFHKNGWEMTLWTRTSKASHARGTISCLTKAHHLTIHSTWTGNKRSIVWVRPNTALQSLLESRSRNWAHKRDRSMLLCWQRKHPPSPTTNYSSLTTTLPTYQPSSILIKFKPPSSSKMSRITAQPRDSHWPTTNLS